MKMQPTYGISDSRLAAYYADLRAKGLRQVAACPFAKAVFYLTGLRYAFSYYMLSRSGSEFETHFLPTHELDDRLREYALNLVIRLMKYAKSRDMTESIKILPHSKDIDNEWFRIQLAWANIDETQDTKCMEWIKRQDQESAWLRLAFAAGVESLWAAECVGFIHPMMRKPFTTVVPYVSDENDRAIMLAIQGFNRDYTMDAEEP